MTRINVSIPPNNLTDEHLLAEHREIKRLPKHFQNRLHKNNFSDIPTNFTLNKGHMNFFLDKGLYTQKRYITLYKECNKRKFNIQNYLENFLIYLPHPKYFNDYQPTAKDKELIQNRIKEKIINSRKKVFHYYKQPITKEQAITLLYANH